MINLKTVSNHLTVAVNELCFMTDLGAVSVQNCTAVLIL